MEIIIQPGRAGEYDDAAAERKPHGVIFLDGQEVANTLQCPHCGGHFVSRRGSGHRRGWCYHCAAVTCGQESCAKCVPMEKQIEAIERRATRELRGY